jgi:L-rhamnose-H+ transport protein
MTQTLWTGLAITLAAGVTAGNCMVPMKFAKRWAWENTWLMFSLVSLLVLPWVLAFWTVNDLLGVYASLDAEQYVVPVLFGAGWGIAQVLFGLSIARLGLALAYNIIIGLGALLGSLVPLVLQNREVIGTGRGNLILGGMAIMIVGIAISGRAGRVRELAAGQAQAGRSGTYTVALLLAILCGVMAPMLNYSFAFGQDIAKAAAQMGTSPVRSGYAVWPIALAGGLVPNLLYSLFLLSRNRTWNRFDTWIPDVSFAGLMGVMWMTAMALYSAGSVYLGALGTSLGWALFQIFMIMTANVSGVLTGEWKAAPREARRGLWASLALLAIATGMIALGNS